MKSWIALFTHRPIGVSIVFIALSVLGLLSLRELAVDLMPSVEVPWITITTSYEGVAPEEIETLITRPIEKQMARVEGVEQLEARSAEGLSRVDLRFSWSMDPKLALDEVRQALDRARTQLPPAAEPPSIYKFNLDSRPILKLALTGDQDMRRLKFLAEERLAPELERLTGVSSVEARGGRDREIAVLLDLQRLLSVSLTANDVVTALLEDNRSVTAGTLDHAGKEVLVRTEGEFDSLDDIGQTVVKVVQGRPIRVADVAEVKDTIRKRRSDLWIDGRGGIELSVYKQSGENTVAVASSVRAELLEINRRYAGQAHLDVLYDASDYIEKAVTGVRTSAILGAALAVIVLLIFLRSFRATLIVAIAIPLSILTTFILMKGQNMTLNLISFGGLALGIGILVDSAVVILESIYRKRDEGCSADESAVEGGVEVAGAVVAGTLTTIAVFVPVVFVGQLAGVVFAEMAAVVSFSLACALGIALSLVPMLAARLLRAKARRPGRFDRLVQRRLDALDAGYERTLRSCLTAPGAVVLAALSLLAAGVLVFEQVGRELMPEADEAQLEADLEMPQGTPLEKTERAIFEMERRMLAVLQPGELDHRLVSVGPEAWWRMDGSNTGEVELLFVPASARQRAVAEIVPEIQEALASLPDAKIQVRSRSTNPLSWLVRGGDDRLAVEIRGHDLETADRLAKQIQSLMKAVPGIKGAYLDRELGSLERTIEVDRHKASELGVSSADVARAVETAIIGTVATVYRDRGDEFDVRVKVDDSALSSLDQLADLAIVSSKGTQVTLGAIAEVRSRVGPATILRIDQERVIRVTSSPSGRPLDDVTRELRERIGHLNVPEGFAISVEGESATQDETFQSLLTGILLSLFLVFSVMSIQFENLVHPLIIMLSVPFALVGLSVSLLVTHTTFNMYSFLGAIVLVGLVVNNAIVLVDYANLLRKTRPRHVVDAIVEAGRRRLRPILMTTLTTLLGLVPLALGLGEGSEMQAPMARAIVGGLVSSTLVTLVLIPAVYVLVEQRRERGAAPPTRRTSGETSPEEPPREPLVSASS